MFEHDPQHLHALAMAQAISAPSIRVRWGRQRVGYILAIWESGDGIRLTLLMCAQDCLAHTRLTDGKRVCTSFLHVGLDVKEVLVEDHIILENIIGHPLH